MVGQIANEQRDAVPETLNGLVAFAVEHALSKLAERDCAPAPRKYLRTEPAAAFLTLDKGTLIGMRTAGRGPAFRKVGSRVVYDVDDLIEWMKSHPLVQPAGDE